MKELQLVLGYLLLNYKVSYDGEPVDILKHRQANVGTVFVEPKIGICVDKLCLIIH